MRYKLELSYSGTGYHGWQRQRNAVSVQQTIEDSIFLLFRERIEIVGCGRTDTGVHAKYYVAHFDSNTYFGKEFVEKLNRYLPKSIAIISISEVLPDFHARFSALKRSYEYVIVTEKNPFAVGFSWYIPNMLNLDLMNKAAEMLYDYTDFTSFSKLHTDVKTNNCKIYEARFVKETGKIVFYITADRFLRNMVRAIVGTIVDIGKNKISIEDFKNIIESKNRQQAGQSAPAEGLFLTEVEY